MNNGILDMHFHSTLSDGRKTTNEIAQLAQSAGAFFVSLTDHDVVSDELFQMLNATKVKVAKGVEISTTNELGVGNVNNLHLTTYSTSFSSKLYDALESLRKGRQSKISAQIRLLSSHGIRINEQNFFNYWQSLGIAPHNLNNKHLMDYIYLDPFNIDRINKISGQDIDSENFLRRCLKKDGDLKRIGNVAVPQYEPNVSTLGEILKDQIFCIAHPNITFKNIEDFLNFVKLARQFGINGIEVNTAASKEWIEVITRTAEEYGMFITFGSDCHFDRKDAKHGDLFEINPLMDEETKRKYMKKILDHLGI